MIRGSAQRVWSSYAEAWSEMCGMFRFRPLCAYIILVVALLLSFSGTAIAGPWVKAPGELYFKASGGVFQGTGLLEVDGSEVEDPEFVYSNQALNFYLETGIAPDFGLAVNVPILFSTNEISERERAKNNGPGDLDIILQYQSYRGQACPVALNIGVRIPMYDGVIGEGSAPGTVGDDRVGNSPEDRLLRFVPALGDGSVDLTPTVSFGCSLHPVPGWFSVEAGPQFRTKGFGEGAKYAVDLGLFVIPERLGVVARVDGIERFQDENPKPTKRLVSLSSNLFLRLWGGFSLEVTGSWVPTGAFLAKGWGLNGGISYNGRVFENPFGS